MVHGTLLVALALCFVVLAACGDPRSEQRAAAGDPSPRAGGDRPISTTPSKDDVVPDRTDTCPPGAKTRPGLFCPDNGRSSYAYRLVKPRPGMMGVKPIPWEGVDVSDRGTTLTLMFVSGVEPCYVLDHVSVEESADSVVATLYEGWDPAHPNEHCIEIAVNKAVQVHLDRPLGERKVVDGAER
jgi:hypothetical protein